MNRRDIVIGIVILAVVAGVIFLRQNDSSPEEEMRVPETLSVEDTIEDRFGLVIPDDVEKAELSDVSGGNASAIATRKVENGIFVHTVLADLPEPEQGVYTAELVKDDQSISTGTLRLAKGGYILEYESSNDLSDYNKVRVNLGGSTILEGNF